MEVNTLINSEIFKENLKFIMYGNDYKIFF